MAKRKIIPIGEIKRRLKEIHGDQLVIVDSSYKGSASHATFVDREFGEWTAWVSNVLQGHSHPSRGKLKIKKTCIEKYGSASPLHRGSLRESFENEREKKHGVRNAMQRPEIQERLKNTLLERYGVDNVQKSPDVRKRTDSSRRNKEVISHWKTGEDIVTVGSYESAVVKWLNREKIDFKWQVPFLIDSLGGNLEGKTYFVDLQILTGDFANKYIEIKGAWIRETQKEKWNWFKSIKDEQAELWMLKDLKALGIL